MRANNSTVLVVLPLAALLFGVTLSTSSCAADADGSQGEEGEGEDEEDVIEVDILVAAHASDALATSCEEELENEGVELPGGFQWVEAEIRLTNTGTVERRASIELQCGATYSADVIADEDDCAVGGDELLPSEQREVKVLFRTPSDEDLGVCSVAATEF